jgi:hypothetical protein
MTNNNNDNTGMYRTGDIVIGSSDPSKSVYSATGTKIIDNGVTIFGSEEDLQMQAKELSKSAMRSGGKPIPLKSSTAKTKQTKKKTSKSNQWSDFAKEVYHQLDEVENMPPQEKPLQTVQFENSFGKIKAKVETLIEHDMAFMLIFRQEEDLVFEPKVGEQLAFYTPDKYRYDVYYPGVTFDSPDNGKKFMILFKLPAEDQE